jgi:hypothetical protein
MQEKHRDIRVFQTLSFLLDAARFGLIFMRSRARPLRHNQLTACICKRRARVFGGRGLGDEATNLA